MLCLAFLIAIIYLKHAMRPRPTPAPPPIVVAVRKRRRNIVERYIDFVKSIGTLPRSSSRLALRKTK